MRKFIKTMRAAKYMGKGEGQSKKGNYGKALEYYQESLKHAHEDIDFLVLNYCLAHSYAKLGQFKEAKTHADKSLKWCEKLADLGESVENVKVRVNEVLRYVDYRGEQSDSMSQLD